MKEYFSTYSKEQAFILDEDGDNYASFDKAIHCIKKNTLDSERSIKHDFQKVSQWAGEIYNEIHNPENLAWRGFFNNALS